MRIAFIVNSKIKKLQNFLADLAKFEGFGHSAVKLLMTEYKGHAIKIAENESKNFDLLVAVGGDGTLNEVLNGIMKTGPHIEKQPRLALVPMGTANDFARIQKIPKSLDILAQAIMDNKFVGVDIGKVRLVNSNNHALYFINVADSGMGAEVVKRLEGRFFRKIPSARLRFAVAIFITFIIYKRKKVKILLDDETSDEGRILTLVAANSSAFGSGLIVAPEAKIDDGKFEVIFGNLSLIGYLMGIGNLLKGMKLRNKGVKYCKAAKIKISATKDLYTQIDGELAGAGSIEIECLPKAINFLLSNT